MLPPHAPSPRPVRRLIKKAAKPKPAATRAGWLSKPIARRVSQARPARLILSLRSC